MAAPMEDTPNADGHSGGRAVTHRYVDPLDAVWLECAARIGLRVMRTSDAYATTDGRGTLALATHEGFDPDDCVAQMVFHELCHSLIEGPDSFDCRDWGLDNETGRDVEREHACLRLQALLARPWGLRAFFAPTTDFRPFYDALPLNPLEEGTKGGREPDEHNTGGTPKVGGKGGEKECVLARRGAAAADCSPWAPHLEHALAATQRIVAAVSDVAGGAAGGHALPTLYARVEAPAPRHPTGIPLPPLPIDDATCGSCAWRTKRGGCLQLGGRHVRAEWAACERWEPASLDCLACGACCREAYGAVVVQARDPARKRHPELIVARDGLYEVRRDGDRCAALHGEHDGPYTCSIYDERPRTCRDFVRGGAHCLTARRRVGLSR